MSSDNNSNHFIPGDHSFREPQDKKACCAKGRNTIPEHVPNLKYYDPKKNWRKIKRHLDDPELNRILVKDFNKFTYGRWGDPFIPGMKPADYESVDWRCERRGRPPAYWAYVKHGACHWLVNFNYRLAQLVEPNRQWRILTSDLHSTVWDGDSTLFDFNFLALGVSPEECFRLARGKMMKSGKYIKVYYAQPYDLFDPE